MKIFLLERLEYSEDGEMRSAVIKAESDLQAREIAANHCWYEGKGVWLDARRSSCKEVVLENSAPGLVLSDVNG